MKIIRSIFCLTILPLISGCHPGSLSQNDINNIGDVEVRLSGPMPETAFYVGPEQGVGAVFGAIGGLIGGLAALGPQDKITKFVEIEKIDLRPAVVSEFKNQLSRDPEFSNRVKDQAPSKLNVKIQLYGLAGETFSSEYSPYLSLYAELIDPSGKVIWHDHDYVAQKGISPKLAFDKFLSSPNVFKAEFDPAIKETVGLLLTRLDGFHHLPTSGQTETAATLQYAAPDAALAANTTISNSPPTASMAVAPLPAAAEISPTKSVEPIKLQPAAPLPDEPTPIAASLVAPPPAPAVAAVPAPPPRSVAAASAPVPQLDPRQQAKFAEFLTKPLPRVFAVSTNGHSASVWGQLIDGQGHSVDLRQRALDGCRQAAGQDCVPYAIDDTVLSTGKDVSLE